MLYPFELEVEATLRSDLHVAGVGRTVALIDRCIERDAQGRALIPATSFKGRTRAHYERLLSALGYDLKGCKPNSWHAGHKSAGSLHMVAGLGGLQPLRSSPSARSSRS